MAMENNEKEDEVLKERMKKRMGWMMRIVNE